MQLPKIPSALLMTPVVVNIMTGQDPYGNATGLEVLGFCRLVEKSKQTFDAEKRLVQLAGCLYMSGDIAPDLPVIEGGTVTISGRSWRIHSADRPRNPDGTVHHTKLYLR